MKKKNTHTHTQIFTNKPLCLVLSILEITKIVMYEKIWREYRCMNTDNCIVYIKTEDIY